MRMVLLFTAAMFSLAINAQVIRAKVISALPLSEDSHVVEVRYLVESANDVPVSVAVIAYEDGKRDLDSIIVAKSVDDASKRFLGANVSVNEEHLIKWYFAQDTDLHIAKLKVEVLALTSESELLPLSLVKFKHNGLTYIASVNNQSDADICNALLWLKSQGVETPTVGGVYHRMGYEVLEGANLEIVNSATRKSLSPEGDRQYAYRVD